MFTRVAETVAAVCVVATGALLVGEPAAGVGKPAGGVIHVFESDPSLTSPVGNIILTGAISDHGKDHAGVAGKNHTINKLILSKGSFEVDVAKLNPPTRLDTKSCTFSSSGTAAVPIVTGSGTGAYRGLTGTTKATLTLIGVLPKTKSGTCNQKAAPLAGFAWVKASGRVSFT
jgi:hypothetical protein